MKKIFHMATNRPVDVRLQTYKKDFVCVFCKEMICVIKATFSDGFYLF